MMLDKLGPLIRGLLFADERSPAQIRAEIREELDGHIQRLREDLARENLPPHDIEARIAERFGDPEAYIRACERIALRDQRMIQKINLALLLLLTFCFAWLFHGNHSSLREQHRMLQAMQAKLDAMSQRAAAPEAGESGTIYVQGDVHRAGAYVLPAGQKLTALRAVAAAGWGEGGEPAAGRELVVLRADGAGRQAPVHTIPAADVASGRMQDFDLRPGDIVQVRTASDDQPRRRLDQ